MNECPFCRQPLTLSSLGLALTYAGLHHRWRNNEIHKLFILLKYVLPHSLKIHLLEIILPVLTLTPYHQQVSSSYLDRYFHCH